MGIGLLGLLWAVTAHAAPSATTAAPADTHVQGRWVYTQRPADGTVEHMATTPSTEDSDVWLLVACGRRLTVALIHARQFPFAASLSSPARLQSDRLWDLSAAARAVDSNLIAIDPDIMRQIMPLLLQEQHLRVSIAESSGAAHDYTFAMQPNDLALGPIRSRCLSEQSES